MKGVRRAGAILLVLAAGCTGKQAGRGSASSAPSLLEVAVFPDRPRVGEPIQVRVGVRSNPGAQVPLTYQWLRNGIPVPGAGSRVFDTKESRKGDRISVQVRIQGQEGLLESGKVTLINTPPRVLSVSVSPAKPFAGQDLTALVSASDPDGDPLTYRYQWARNGQEVPGATQSAFPGGGVQRGDQIALRVVASDGQDTSETARAVPVTAVGRPPLILSQPPTAVPQQGVFSYQVVARDPQGGPVAYSLLSGPPGMTLDPGSGLLTWTIPQDQGGSFPVTVRASTQDGFADQAFTLHF